jgi:xylulokinase
MSLFIGIDSGTQSTKAIVLDLETGKVVAEARASYQLIPNLPVGHMEQHPSAWTEALDKVILSVLEKVDRSAVAGIGVSGQQHGFVPLDEAGEVIRPAKLWCDTSTVPECEAIMKKLGGPKATLKKTGNLVLAGFTAGKIAWLKKKEPANYRRLRHVLLPHDYLNFHLTGQYFMEFGDASGTALMDVRKAAWSKAAIDAIDPKLAQYLPKISPSHAAAGTLRPEIAERYGLSTSVVVSAGGGDNMMGAIGTGNVEPGVVTASFGTSGTIYAFSKKPVCDPDGEIAAFCSSTGGWLPLLCTMNVTSVTEHMRNLFGWDVKTFDDQVATVPAGCDGLCSSVLCRRAHAECADRLGLVHRPQRKDKHPGSLRPRRDGRCHARYELRPAPSRPARREGEGNRITGGGAKSPVWRQMMADVFGVPVVAMVEDEGAALGGALQAAWCVARQSNSKAKLEDITRRMVALDEATRCQPNKANVAIYRKMQDLHDQLSRALRPLFPVQRKIANS